MTPVGHLPPRSHAEAVIEATRRAAADGWRRQVRGYRLAGRAGKVWTITYAWPTCRVKVREQDGASS